MFLADGRIVDDMSNPTSDMVLDRIKQLGQKVTGQNNQERN